MYAMKRIYLILSTVIFQTNLVLAHISPDMHFTHIDAGDGLTIGSVTGICVDGRGVVWAGTGYGLNSYDGNSVKQHELFAQLTKRAIANSGERKQIFNLFEFMIDDGCSCDKEFHSL